MKSAAAILLALLPFTACSGGSSATPTPADSPTPNATATGSPIPTAAGSPSSPSAATLTYNDRIYGYSFEYPASWTLDTKGMILYSYNPATVPSGDVGKPVPKDKLKVFFWVAEGVGKSIAEWLDNSRNNPGQPPPPTVVSRTDVTIDGRQGLDEVVESDGELDTGYYIPLGSGRVFAVAAGPSDSLVWPQFETVLASIRLPSS